MDFLLFQVLLSKSNLKLLHHHINLPHRPEASQTDSKSFYHTDFYVGILKPLGGYRIGRGRQAISMDLRSNWGGFLYQVNKKRDKMIHQIRLHLRLEVGFFFKHR